MTQSATATITMEEEGNLVVTVLDGTGSAISGASVEISGTQSSVQETDSSGEAVFDPIQIGPYDITVSKTGFFDASGSVAEEDFS